MKFTVVEGAVMPKGSMEFTDAKSAAKTPLAKALFKLEGVTRVFFGRDFVTVNKDADTSWTVLRAGVIETLMDFYGSKKPLFADETENQNGMQILPGDSDLVQMIKEILETRIRPAIQQDGGDITYMGFESGVVLLKMQGACSGCSSSAITLKNGIERMLKHWIPEVTGVVAVSDEDLDKINLDQFKQLEADIKKKQVI